MTRSEEIPTAPEEWLARLGGEDAARFEDPVPTHEDTTPFRPGVVPPPGPLPQGFGFPPAVLWVARLAVVGVVAVAFSEAGLDFVRDIVDARGWFDIVIPALAALFFLIRRIGSLLRGGARQKDQIFALGVVVEPTGIVVHSWLSRREFAWTDIAGLQRRPDTSEEALRIHERGRWLLVIVPNAGWGPRFLGLVSGREVGDGRFEGNTAPEVAARAEALQREREAS